MSTRSTISRHGIALPMDQVAEFCRRWKIQELSMFGSYLRDDFRPDSDLDFLYTFADGWAGVCSTSSRWTTNLRRSWGVLSISSIGRQSSKARTGFGGGRFWARRR